MMKCVGYAVRLLLLRYASTTATVKAFNSVVVMELIALVITVVLMLAPAWFRRQKQFPEELLFPSRPRNATSWIPRSQFFLRAFSLLETISQFPDLAACSR